MHFCIPCLLLAAPPQWYLVTSTLSPYFPFSLLIGAFSGLFGMLVQDPTFGQRGRLEKFVGNTYAPLLTRKPVKALIVAVFTIIFVSCLRCKTFNWMWSGMVTCPRDTLLHDAF